MASIFSNLPNNLIMNIIKMAEDERKKEEQIELNKYLFSRCIYELKSFSEYIDREEDGVFIAKYDKYDRGTRFYLSSITGRYYDSSDEDDY